MIILGTNSIKDTGYNVANSCRFNDGSSDYLSKSFSSGNQKTFTFSTWFKLGNSTDNLTLFATGADAENRFWVMRHNESSNNSQIKIDAKTSTNQTIELRTNASFRDSAAWMHLVVAVDTTQATDTNRVKVYINGSQVTSFNQSTYPAEDHNTEVNKAAEHRIGRYNAGDNYWDGYMCETVFIDGTQYAASDFGEFDSDSPTIWKPKDVSGLTFGTNGAYLDYEDSSALGNDVSGNNNDFTANNLASTDQSIDSCTNNFCTVNPLDSYYASSTFSEGNLKIVTEASLYSYNTSTIGLTKGKWYCEVYIETTPHPGTKDSMIGIAGRMSEADNGYLGLYADTYGIYGGNGNIYNDGNASYGVSHTTGDIIGIYLDLDNNKLYFAKNGTLMNSGTGKDITAVTNTKAGAYFMVADDFGNGYQGTYRMNFGSPIYALSSANTDANGYGSFEYNPSAGTFDGASKDFLAICTKNLAEYGG